MTDLRKILFTLFLIIPVICMVTGEDSLPVVAAPSFPFLAGNDTNKIIQLNEFASDNLGEDNAKSIAYADSALALSKKSGWLKGMAEASTNLGFAYFYTGNYSASVENYKKAISFYENLADKAGQADDLGNLGVVYRKQSDYPKALDCFEKALRISLEINDQAGAAFFYGSIGIVYWYLSKLNIALEYFQKSLAISEARNDKNSISRQLGNIAAIYLGMENYEKSLEYYKKAVSLALDIGDQPAYSRHLGNIGVVYRRMENYSKSLEYYLKALEINEKLGDKNAICNNLGNIGVLYYQLANWNKRNGNDSLIRGYLEKSVEYHVKALSMYKGHAEQDDQKTFLFSLSDAYFELGEYEKSYNTYKEGISIRDTLFSVENRKKISEIEIRQERALKEKEKQQLEQKVRLQQLGLAAQISQLRLLEYDKVLENLEMATKNDEMKLLENDRKLKEFDLRKKIIESDKNAKNLAYQNLRLRSQKNNQDALLVGILLLAGFLFFFIRERKKSETLLLNVLPVKIAGRLKKNKGKPIADLFTEATVVYCDIVGFTTITNRLKPEELVKLLNDIFSKLDNITRSLKMEKIKTIGDCYMVAAGIPEPGSRHVYSALKWALETRKQMQNYKTSDGSEISFRIGIDSGTVVAGVIGRKKFSYDLWGQAVNTASRMESFGIPGEIQVTEKVRNSFMANAEFNRDLKISFRERNEFVMKTENKEKTYIVVNE